MMFKTKMDSEKERLNVQCIILSQLLNEILSETYDNTGRNKELFSSLEAIQESLVSVISDVRRVENFSCQYDFSEDIKGNGYRSYVRLFIQSVESTIQQCNHIKYGKKKWLFSNERTYVKSLDSWRRVFASYTHIFPILIKIHESSNSGCLIPPHSAWVLQDLESSRKISTTVFYEENIGFQFIPRMRLYVKIWCIVSTIYGEVYNGTIPFTRYLSTLHAGLRYIMSDEERAKRYLRLSSLGSVDFFRKFLALADSRVATQFSYMLRRNISVNSEISLAPVNVKVVAEDGSTVIITAPSAHVGCRPISCHLLSARLRRGMPCISNKQTAAAPSRKLVVYYHGGGFISVTSKTCELYTRDWSMKLDVPIFCVDYTLAPEARYPRQLEECFYAYCWALQNAHRLGTTAESICICGDSAGGNLAIGVVLKCIEHGIPIPSGVFAVYSPFILETVIFPGRILCLVDPVMPFGFLTQCFEAYIGRSNDEILDKLKNLVVVDDTDPNSTVSPATTGSIKEQTDRKTITSIAISTSIKTTGLLVTCIKRSLHRVLHYAWSCLPSSKVIQGFSGPPESGQPNSGRRADINVICHRGKDRDSRTRSKPHSQMSITRNVGGRPVTKEFHRSTVSPDPYLSPYYATEEMLSKLPEVHLMTTEMEVCLDDNVAFAKKLSSCGVNVTLDILKGLPHGFLMFALMSKEAMEGSDQAVERVRSVLKKEKPLITF